MARTVGRIGPVRGWLLAPFVALVLFLVPMPAWAVDEFYSRDLYPWLQRWMTALTNLAPFAVLDLLIVIALGLVTCAPSGWCRSSVRPGSSLRAASRSGV